MRQTSSFQPVGQRHRLAEKVVPTVIPLGGLSPLPAYRLTVSASLCLPRAILCTSPSLPGLLTLQIVEGFQPHGEHVLGVDAAES